MRSPLSFCRGDEATSTWGIRDITDPWQHNAAPMRSPNQGEELRDDSLGFSPDCMGTFVKAEFRGGVDWRRERGAFTSGEDAAGTAPTRLEKIPEGWGNSCRFLDRCCEGKCKVDGSVVISGGGAAGMLSAGIEIDLLGRGNSCRFLDRVGEVIVGCVPVGIVCGPGERPMLPATVVPRRERAFSRTAPNAARGEG